MLKQIALALSLLCAALAMAEETFPIMAWNGTWEYGERATAIDFYRDMKDCGFSIAGMTTSPEHLELIRAAGLQCIWHDGNAFSNQNLKVYDVDVWKAKVASAVEKYRDDPGVYGFYVRDEPNGDEIDGVLKLAEIV